MPRAVIPGLHIGSLSGWYGATTPYFDLGQRSLRLWNTGTTWKRLETSKGTWATNAVARLDANVAIAQQQGVQLVMTLGQPPGWASETEPDPGNSYNPAPPVNDADWTDYIAFVAARMPTGSAYEVWNEIDLDHYWSGTTARLIELHNLAYDTIKGIDPTAKVLSASVSSDATALIDYLPSVADKTDVIGMHAYVHPNQPDDDETATVDLSGYSSGVDVLGEPITLSASYEVTMSPVFVTR